MGILNLSPQRVHISTRRRPLRTIAVFSKVGEAEEGSQDDYLGPQMPEMDQMDGDNGTVPDHIIARRARVRLAAER